MILNRLAKAIRKQDWFTVVLEFVIVVFGIFVGLQANEWAQERQDRKHEQAALERLFLESQNALQLLHEELQGTLQINLLRRNAVQFVDSNAPVPENQLPLKIGVNTLGRFPGVLPVSVTYDELKSSGQMQLIRSAALREQVAEFHTDILLSTYNWETLRTDEGFIFAVIGLLRNQLVAESGLVELRDRALSLCQALGEAIGRCCDPPQ